MLVDADNDLPAIQGLLRLSASRSFLRGLPASTKAGETQLPG